MTADGAQGGARQRAGRIALRALYWLAVLAISIGILIGMVLYLESRDTSQVGGGSSSHAPARH